MLPKSQRLSQSTQIRDVIRNGFVVRTPSAIAHAQIEPGVGIKFGYITGKKLGGAVTRNRAKRRFRDLTQPLLNDPVGKQQAIFVMWRLQPSCILAPASELDRDINRIWAKVLKRAAV